MGFSAKQGKKEIVQWVDNDKDSISSILDIGPGQGTYFNLLSPMKQFLWEGIEAWKPYIEKFQLEKKYNKIYNEDARNFNWDEKFYDLIIAGDILEHMSKEDAVILVENCLNHSKQLIISIPIVYMPQGELENNPFEVHVKPDWSDEEVKTTWGNYIKDSSKVKMIGVYLLSK
jgi:predicted TPR repeat methyltransferase